jgi:hypothetical protein
VSANFWCWVPTLALAPYSHDFLDRVDRLHRTPFQPPATAIVEFVGGLQKRYPDISVSDETAWADGPMLRDANGQFIDFSIRWDYYDKVVPFVVSTALRFHLDCLDPQTFQYYTARNPNGILVASLRAASEVPVTSSTMAIKRARHACGLDDPADRSRRWRAVLMKNAKFGDEWYVSLGQRQVAAPCGTWSAEVKADGSSTSCAVTFCKSMP